MKYQLDKYSTAAKTISLFLLLIICSLLVNSVLFTHAHVMPNGEIVSHAHPYNKAGDSSPFKSHHHSQAEFYFLENLDVLFFSFSSILLLAILPLLVKYSCILAPSHSCIFVRTMSGRAPPMNLVK